MGIPDNIQDTNWDVSILVGVQEDISSPCRARNQGSLGYQEMEYGP
jgi:hypothetical protein